MSTEVIISPDLWDEEAEGVITSWLVSDKSRVETGDLIAEIMVEKVQHEIQAPATGTLIITKAEDEIINKSDVIAHIET